DPVPTRKRELPATAPSSDDPSVLSSHRSALRRFTDGIRRFRGAYRLEHGLLDVQYLDAGDYRRGAHIADSAFGPGHVGHHCSVGRQGDRHQTLAGKDEAAVVSLQSEIALAQVLCDEGLMDR